MDAWLAHFKDQLPEMSNNDKIRLEDATGHIPLLLKSFIECQGISFMDTWNTRFAKSDNVRKIYGNLLEFSKEKCKSMGREFDDYVEFVVKCLLEMSVVDIGSLYDHRYFYVDANNYFGRYVCGLVRDSMADVLRELGRKGIFL